MFKVIVNKERCKGCKLCIENCPKGVFKVSKSFNKMGYHYIEVEDDTKCNGCKRCVIVCPDVAIEIFLTEDNKKLKIEN